jgi:SecD/SecF fusion protein
MSVLFDEIRQNMSTTLRNILILLATIALSVYFITPMSEKLRLGKDLAGGATLVYAVDLKPGEGPETLAKVITVIKERLDPNGVMEISVVGQGADRIEISMPLPGDEVKGFRKAFEDELAKFSSVTVTRTDLERGAADIQGREAWIQSKAKGDAAFRSKIEAAFRDYDALQAANKAVTASKLELQEIKDQIRNLNSPADDAKIAALNAQLPAAEAKQAEAIDAAAKAAISYETTRDAALAAGLSGADLRRSLQLSSASIRLPSKSGQAVERPSPRAAALADIEKRFPDQKAQVDAVVAKWNDFEKKRRSLDDPQDIVRILAGAGVLNFRITVAPGEYAQENEARAQLRQGGPSAVTSTEARWYKINKLQSWVQSVEDLDALRANPAQFFGSRGYVADEYKGQPYILCWDRRGMRLTEAEKPWDLARSYSGTDQLGRPAIDFVMDSIGADKLGELTSKNIHKQMAVLLDDEVYTAPTLQSRISSQGQITGNFSQSELDYIIRVLGAGSMQNKISGPISQSVTGPQLGAENLRQGFKAGVVSFIIVGIFMVGYYFRLGMVAMIALLFNLLLIVAAMAANYAAFTLPGIAGIILTFGQAVDANVLVYERMREEFNRGADLRTAVRLGFSKAMSAIVDGNVTTLIVCVVLGIFGTQEIKGFALTLGIGTVTTLFAQLFFSRVVFTVMVEHLGWRRTSMLPMVGDNWLGKRLIPKIDWMGIRFVSYGITAALMMLGIGFIVVKGRDLLGTEFRGGTAVTVQLKSTGTDTNGHTSHLVMKRSDVDDLVKKIADEAPEGSPLKEFRYAEVIAVNPDPDGVKSSTFTIKTLVTDPDLVQNAIGKAFGDKIDIRQGRQFTGDVNRSSYAISSPKLGDSIERPNVTLDATDFYGGVAVVLSNITPPISREELATRIEAKRNQPDFRDVQGRTAEVVVLEGTENAVSSAAVLVKDPSISYFDDARRWEIDVRDREWKLATGALATTQSMAEVQSFSPAVADTFRNNALVAVGLSTLLIIIYIWIRFNSIRYSVAAMLTTIHDCICAVGFVALATWLFEHMNPLATTLGILPFKIDLNVMAAIMTTLGYSLNDTIIVMDRIRENRGKRMYATRQIINDAINQTISRTLITSGTTFIAVMALYLVGGEGIRVFAYTMLMGVIVGTYSSIAVAAPLVWSHRHENDDQLDASQSRDLGRAAA